MRRGMDSAVPSKNVVCLLPAPDRIISIVAAVYPKNVFVIVIHLAYHTAGVREKLAAVKGIPLATGENHDGNVLIRLARPPLRIPKNNYRPAFCPDHSLVISRIQCRIPLMNQNRIPLPAAWQKKRETVLRVMIAKR